jgi:hypothetical protein
MKKVAMLLALLATNTNAATYIFTPGGEAKVILETASGYTVADMGGGEMTQVLDLGSMTAIIGGGRPASFIMDGGQIGREWGGTVLPAVNPNTGNVDTVVPVPVEFQ